MNAFLKRRLLQAGALWTLCGCTQVSERVAEVTSVRVTLREPMDSALGVEGKPVQPKELLFDLTVLDDQGAVAGGDFQVDAFLASGGGRLSLRDPCTGLGGSGVDGGDSPPWLLSRYTLRNGVLAGVRVPLADPVLGPLLFGRVALTVMEARSGQAGATPPIYFPNPTVRQLMEPLSLDVINASYCNRFVGRQASLAAAGAGKLVVSSVFANAFAVTDSGDSAFNSLYVFTFSQPSSLVRVGRVLQRLSGIVGQFNGAVQLANATVTPSMELAPGLVPKPVELLEAGRPQLQSAKNPIPQQNKDLIKLISSPVRLSAFVCDLSDARRAASYNNFSTFVVTYDPKSALKDGCDSRKTFSVQLPSRGFAGFSPDDLAGKEITITGMLKNGADTSTGTLFWTVVVRDALDVCLKPAAQCPN